VAAVGAAVIAKTCVYGVSKQDNIPFGIKGEAALEGLSEAQNGISPRFAANLICDNVGPAAGRGE